MCVCVSLSPTLFSTLSKKQRESILTRPSAPRGLRSSTCCLHAWSLVGGILL